MEDEKSKVSSCNEELWPSSLLNWNKHHTIHKYWTALDNYTNHSYSNQNQYWQYPNVKYATCCLRDFAFLKQNSWEIGVFWILKDTIYKWYKIRKKIGYNRKLNSGSSISQTKLIVFWILKDRKYFKDWTTDHLVKCINRVALVVAISLKEF